MPIIECKNERCVFHSKRVRHKGFVERCAKRRVHINEAGICKDFEVKLKRVIQTLDRLKKKA